MSAVAFRAFGVVTLLLNFMFFGSGLAERVWMAYSLSQQVRLLLTYTVIAMVGGGLIYLRKWAAVYFSLFLFCCGSWVLWGFVTEIENNSSGWNLFSLCEGVSLLLPALITKRLWSQLTWSGKWFF